MNATERAALITLLCNVIAERLGTDELAQLATVVTQIGTTLGFLAAQQVLDESSASENSASSCKTANGSTASSVSAEVIEGSTAETVEEAEYIV